MSSQLGRALSAIGAICIGVFGIIRLEASPAFLIGIVTFLGAVAVIAYRRGFLTLTTYTYLSIDSDGIHHQQSRTGESLFISWDRIKDVREKYEEGFIGMELKIVVPNGWQQWREVSLRSIEDLNAAVTVIRRIIE